MMILKFLLNTQIQKWNLGKKLKVSRDFDDTFPYMINNKNLNPVVTELLIRDR